ncbi:hypothetical protein HYALB_00011310 [Hymenoscyphus albidus]|uniref:Cytochrome P450 n=1 Tax=Hymenoscyphus albidus TaxID=595503 RepID=A0A9N9LEF3_9HELO|nr:hypothetical protein HYALB_00011310 [Hymenoscyphus albidus]
MAFLLILLALASLYLSHSVYKYINSPLKNIPGPFIAKFTDLWRLFDTLGGRAELTHIHLHAKYGPAVRLGPNLSNFYKVADMKVGRNIFPNIFSARNNEIHSLIRSSIAPFYKLSALLKFEPLIHETIQNFYRQLEKEFIDTAHATKQKVVPIDEWISYIAWDMTSNITFSRSMGLLNSMSDHSGWLGNAERAMDWLSVTGQLPFIDWLIAKNPIMPIGPSRSLDKVGEWAYMELMARQSSADVKTKKTSDMLDDFLSLKEKYGPEMHDGKIVNILMINLTAGSDTTAIILRSIIYFVLKHPHVYEMLQEALYNCNDSSEETVSFAVARKIPYLEAVILEARRIHPGVGLLLELVVPEPGLELSNGTFLPAGTVVGMNAYVTHRDKRIFGQDADTFNPHRWSRHIRENEEEYQARLNKMKQNDLSFGAGKRLCIGKELSEIETYKVIASLFLKYDMELVNPNKEWKVQNSFFVIQSGIDIRIRPREKKPK